MKACNLYTDPSEVAATALQRSSAQDQHFVGWLMRISLCTPLHLSHFIFLLFLPTSSDIIKFTFIFNSLLIFNYTEFCLICVKPLTHSSEDLLEAECSYCSTPIMHSRLCFKPAHVHFKAKKLLPHLKKKKCTM